MNQYRRIVSYLYKYTNDKKGENTGFVRIDTREDGIRFHVHIKDFRMMDEKQLKVYFYFHREGRIHLVFVDEFVCVRGNCEYKKQVFPDFTDTEFDEMNGIVILDQRGLLYGSCWDEKEISEELFLDTEVEESLHTSELPEIKTFMVEGKDVKKESLLSQWEVIDLAGAEDIVSAVKIQIQDISKLPSKEWKLADNAFLKQGYEAENHLLLGKIRLQNNKEIWILGVPGNYDNREKYLAGIFGFSDYIPKEQREFKTGGSGYWIRQISSVE